MFVSKSFKLIILYTLKLQIVIKVDCYEKFILKWR